MELFFKLSTAIPFMKTLYLLMKIPTISLAKIKIQILIGMAKVYRTSKTSGKNKIGTV